MSGKHPSTGDPSRPRHMMETISTPAMRDEVAHLRTAMASQRDIGMAIGLLSAVYRCSTGEAWRTLLRISQDSNTKIRHIAHCLVATHDGTADDADGEVLRSFVAHLPGSCWPPAR